jgi:CheY-like chemotaxis protein
VQTTTLEMLDCPKRILLAEDDADLRFLLAAALARDGHLITEAADGTEILEQLAATLATLGEPEPTPQFDLIISDIRMPGWSGLDVLAGLRHYPVVPPVVLITAFGGEQLHADARRLGAVATLDKPFDLDELRAIVRAALLP